MVDQMGRWYPDFPGQHPYQDPAYMRLMAQQAPQPGPAPHGPQGPQGTQMMTPPTIHAEIIQVDDLEAVDRHAMTPGTTQMYMTKDERFIVIRSMYANGQHADVVYDRRPPAPPAPTLNPDDYIRRDELPGLIAEALQAQTAPRKAPAKEKEAA